MDAFAIQNQIFSSQVEESNRVFQDMVNQQLLVNTQAAGLGSSQSYQGDAAFAAKYAAMKADIARVHAEIEEDHKRLGF